MRVLKVIGVLLHYVFNTLLALMFCGLAMLAIILLREGEAPIPPFVTDILHEELAKEGFVLTYKDLAMDLRGMLFARDVKIYAQGNSDPFFEARLLLVKISLFRALIGDYQPTEVSLSNGAFYCPAVISPKGKSELMVDNIHIHAQRRLSDWQIDTFLLETLGARIKLHGNVFMPIPGIEAMKAEMPEEEEETPPDLVAYYIGFCQTMLELQKPFSYVEGLILDLELSGERKGPLNVRAQVFHEGFYDQEAEIRLGAGSARLSATLGTDGVLRADDMGRAWLDSLQWNQDVKTGYTEAAVEIGDGLKGFASYPTQAELYCYNIEAWGLPFDGAFAVLDMNRLDATGKLDGQVMLKSGRNWLSVQGPFKPKDQSGRLMMEARWNPMFFLQTTAIPADDIPEGIEVVGRPFWRADVELLPGFNPGLVNIDVHFGPLSYDAIKLNAARVKGLIGKDKLDLYSVNLVASDYALSGNYFQRFSTGDYRFQAKGTIWPSILDFVIGEQWWTDLWKDIKFNGPPPKAAIDMSGQYGADGKKNHIYGDAELINVSYRGVAVDRAFTRIWQLPKHLDLFDFDLKTPNGHATTNVHFENFPNGRRKYLSFQARTHLTIVNGATIASEAAVPIARRFPSEAPPYIDIVGLVHGETAPKANELFLKACVFFPDKFEFEDVRFDNGSFTVVLTPEQITVSEGRMGLGGGKAALYTQIDRQPDGSLYVDNAKLSILDAKLYALYEAIPFLRVARAKAEALEKIKRAKNTDDNEEPEDPRTFEERYAGDVKLFFDAHGQLPDLNSFVGSGTLVLTNANLGQLHLLGGLSSFLYSIGLHLGTLNFNHAQSDFTLARSNLYFPNGQIGGNTGEIEANGNFDIANETLDFLIVLHPFGNMETPVFSEIFTLFSPLADSIEVEVSGTLTAPKFDIDLRPFGVFTGKNQVVDKNADIIQLPVAGGGGDASDANDSE